MHGPKHSYYRIFQFVCAYIYIYFIRRHVQGQYKEDIEYVGENNTISELSKDHNLSYANLRKILI